MRRPRPASGRWIGAIAALVILSGCGGEDGGDRAFAVRSPDGRLVLEVAADEGAGGWRWRVLRDGGEVLGWAELGLETDVGTFVEDLRVVSARRRIVDEHYRMRVGKRSDRHARGEELELGMREPGGAELTLVLRAHDDGVAFRYRLEGSGEVVVERERTRFAPPREAQAYMAPFDLLGLLLKAAYEIPPRPVAVGASTDASGWAFPALFELADGEAWVLLTEAELDGDYCAGRLGPAPADGVYDLVFPRPSEGRGIGEVTPRSERPFATPWRVAIVGDLATVVESTLVEDLSAPARTDDAAWVRPGTVAWSWYSQDTGDLELQRRYLDFAVEAGLEHLLIDARWDRWPDAEREVPRFVAEAADRGIGVHLWYNSGGRHNLVATETPRDRMDDPSTRRAEMDVLATWGVAGIKVDFFDSDKQDRIQQYLGILQDALDRRLLVNLHGATLPRGWQRTFPNLMTTEAVRGSEAYRFVWPGPFGRDDVLYAFTRNVVGSMDYTPTVFEDALRVVGSTYAHELALPVVFESGLTHLADRGDGEPGTGYRAVFDAFPFVRDFLADLPSAWDETLLLAGHPRSHVVLARRAGEEWYVGAISGDGSVTERVELPFLDPALAYESERIGRGGGPAELVRVLERRARDDVLEIVLAPDDGVVWRLRPAAPVAPAGR